MQKVYQNNVKRDRGTSRQVQFSAKTGGALLKSSNFKPILSPGQRQSLIIGLIVTGLNLSGGACPYSRSRSSENQGRAVPDMTAETCLAVVKPFESAVYVAAEGLDDDHS